MELQELRGGTGTSLDAGSAGTSSTLASTLIASLGDLDAYTPSTIVVSTGYRISPQIDQRTITMVESLLLMHFHVGPSPCLPVSPVIEFDSDLARPLT